MLILEFTMYALALWLGLYLINRDPRTTHLLLAGMGSVMYAAAVALSILEDAAQLPALVNIRWLVLFFPSLLWTGALIYLLPEDISVRATASRVWRWILLPCAFLLALISLALNAAQSEFSPLLYLSFATIVLLPLLWMVVSIWRNRRWFAPSAALGLVITATLFFALGISLLLFPLRVLPTRWLLPLTALDFLALGVAVSILDAFDQGETLLPDFIRSLDYAMLNASLFALPVVAVMALETGATFAMRALLLVLIALALATATFASRIEVTLDRLIFARFPRLRQARAELRAAADALPRLSPAVNFDDMDDAEFARLTRRAISSLTDLPKLAASPLTFLPLIETRLSERGEPMNTLTRAAELKRVLVDSIERLRPPNANGLRTTDEWRHYNALYFPYVLGLKPFTRLLFIDEIDPEVESILEWFRASVPERTLHNWQTAAAKLVAQDLREQQRNAQPVASM